MDQPKSKMTQKEFNTTVIYALREQQKQIESMKESIATLENIVKIKIDQDNLNKE